MANLPFATENETFHKNSMKTSKNRIAYFTIRFFRKAGG